MMTIILPPPPSLLSILPFLCLGYLFSRVDCCMQSRHLSSLRYLCPRRRLIVVWGVPEMVFGTSCVFHLLSPFDAAHVAEPKKSRHPLPFPPPTPPFDCCVLFRDFVRHLSEVEVVKPRLGPHILGLQIAQRPRRCVDRGARAMLRPLDVLAGAEEPPVGRGGPPRSTYGDFRGGRHGYVVLRRDRG